MCIYTHHTDVTQVAKRKQRVYMYACIHTYTYTHIIIYTYDMHIHTSYRYGTGREAQRARRQGHETDQDPRSNARGVYPQKEPYASATEPYIYLRIRAIHINPQKRYTYPQKSHANISIKEIYTIYHRQNVKGVYSRT